MIETEDIKLHTFTCDVPGCAALEEMASRIPFNTPANWTTIPLNDHDGLVLCPDHAQYRPIIRTVLLALDRRGAPIEDSHT